MPLPYGFFSAWEFADLLLKEYRQDMDDRPEWSHLGLSFRERLQSWCRRLPAPTEILSVDAIKRAAEEAVWGISEPFLLGYLNPERLGAWREECEARSPGRGKLLDRYIADPEALALNVRIGHFEDVADDLLALAPDSFRSMYVLGLEMQLWQSALLKRWLGQGSDAEFSHGERVLLAHFSSVIKDFNSAFLLQSYLTERDIGEKRPPVIPAAEEEADLQAHAIGTDYLFYDHARQSHVPLASVFPAEMRAIKERFEALSAHIEHALSPETSEENALPHDRWYAELAEFLDMLATLYGSHESSAATIGRLVMGIKKHYAKLRKKGCPMYPLHAGTVNISSAADSEFRLVVTTRESMRDQRMLDRLRERLEEKILPVFAERVAPGFRCVLRTVAANHYFPAGPNIYWRTRGESFEGLIVIHPDAIAEVAEKREIPTLERMFILDTPIDPERYVRGALVDTAMHEVWHQFGSKDDGYFVKRQAIEPDDDESVRSLSEYKSEAGTARGVLACREALEEEGLDLRTMSLVRLGAVCDSLRFKSPNGGGASPRYYYAQIAILGQLFDGGLLGKSGERFVLPDPDAALGAVARLCEQLESLFLDVGHPAGSIDAFVAKTKKRARETDIVDFLARLG